MRDESNDETGGQKQRFRGFWSNRVVAMGLMFLCVSREVAAHHSYAMFEQDRVESVTGMVKIWEMSNPHAYLWVYVETEPQKYALYGFEAPGPSELTRNGWNCLTVQPGDRVTVTYAPLRDGRYGGNLKRLELSDGRVLEPTGAGQPDKGKAIHE